MGLGIERKKAGERDERFGFAHAGSVSGGVEWWREERDPATRAKAECR